MIQIIQNIKDRLSGKVPAGAPRSPKWPGVRDAYLKLHPSCAVCGGTKSLQVHHRMPFHLHPDMELDPLNLITLCEASGVNCHLTFGHAGDFKGVNSDIDADAIAWMAKFAKSAMMAKGGAASS